MLLCTRFQVCIDKVLDKTSSIDKVRRIENVDFIEIYFCLLE